MVSATEDPAVQPSRTSEKARSVATLLSYGHRHQHYDSRSETTSSDDDATDASSDYGQPQRGRRQAVTPAAPGISSTVAVLGVLLVLAIAAAVFLGMRNFRSADTELTTSTSTQGNSAGGAASAPGTIIQTVTSIVTSPSGASFEPGGSLSSGNFETGSASAGQSTQSSPTKPQQGSSSSQAEATGSGQNAGADTPFINTILDGHNKFRKTHHAADLIWNATLQAAAQKWAEHCVWEHSEGKVGPYGENLSAVVPFQQNDKFDPMSGISVWNGEEKDYDYSKPTGFTQITGHFTQVVWIGTQQIGCAFTTCEGFFGHPLGAFFVCEYWPGGNIVTDDLKYFKENVKQP